MDLEERRRWAYVALRATAAPAPTLATFATHPDARPRLPDTWRPGRPDPRWAGKYLPPTDPRARFSLLPARYYDLFAMAQVVALLER